METIDAAIVAGGFPRGPFALMDLVGVDVDDAVARALFAAFHAAPRFRPSPVQARLVAAGTLGRKTGGGFYRYDTAGRVLGPAEEFAADGAALPADEIRTRIELAIVNEAYHAAGERGAPAGSFRARPHPRPAPGRRGDAPPGAAPGRAFPRRPRALADRVGLADGARPRRA